MKDILLDAELNFKAGSSDKTARFSMLAYTGGLMTPAGWDAPTVIDLSGLKFNSQKIPIVYGHDMSKAVGHTESIKVSTDIKAEGKISRRGAYAEDIQASGKEGYPWQASIGLRDCKAELIKEGDTREVNGQTFNGPFYVVKASRLHEISFVEYGADENTEALVASKKKENELDNRNHMENKIMSKENDKENVEAKDNTPSEIEALRNEIEALKNAPPQAIVRGKAHADKKEVLEAALSMSAGLQDVEKEYTPQALEAASKQFSHGLTIGELLYNGARENGFTGSTRDVGGILNASFATLTTPDVLSNVANKFAMKGFTHVDDTWRKIAKISSVKDFKEKSSIRLTGDNKFEAVAKDGVIPQGALADDKFTNSVSTYGKALTITRQDLINDDLGLFNDLFYVLGRGAGLKFNEDFWDAFEALGITDTVIGGTFDTALLTSLYKKFAAKTDSDGNVLGLPAKYLLVSPDMYIPARQAMESTQLLGDSGYAQNAFAGMWEPIVSPYLDTLSVYLIADPQALPLIDVSFLNGVQVPTIESFKLETGALGIRTQGYIDYGIGAQDKNAAVEVSNG